MSTDPVEHTKLQWLLKDPLTREEELLEMIARLEFVTGLAHGKVIRINEEFERLTKHVEEARLILIRFYEAERARAALSNIQAGAK